MGVYLRLSVSLQIMKFFKNKHKDHLKLEKAESTLQIKSRGRPVRADF